MERGPLTLFGAIVAVGVGPALWLGAQLGTVDVAPDQRPSTVGEQYPAADMDFGGVGAGETPEQTDVLRVESGDPVTVTPSSPAPVRTPARPSPVAVVTSSVPPSPATFRPSALPSTSDRVVSPSPARDEEPSPEPSAEPSTEASTDPEPSFSFSPAPDDEGEDRNPSEDKDQDEGGSGGPLPDSAIEY